MAEIQIYTDGACRGNNSGKPNIGAYAYTLIWGEHKKSDAQAVRNTTNNQMELLAAIKALKALKPAAKSMTIDLFSDSQYVVKGVNEWSKGWKAKGRLNVKNAELWQELISLVEDLPHLNVQYVPGHSTSEYNNYVDYLCNAAMDVELQKEKH